jgi:hypothetical protein
LSGNWQLHEAVGALSVNNFRGIQLDVAEGERLRVAGDHSPETRKAITEIILSVDPGAVPI